MVEGLHMIVNIDQDNYSESIGDTSGLRIVIHHQKQMPFPEDCGITINPGEVTSISIKQVRMHTTV